MARSLSSARALALLTALALSLTLVAALGSSASADPTDPLFPKAPSARSAGHPDTPRLPPECATVAELIPRTPMKCQLNPHIKGAPTIVLMGDSHSWQMIPAIRRAIGDRRVNFVGFIFGACPPMDPALDTLAERRNANNCQKTGHKAVRFIENAAQQNRRVRVVVGAAWQIYHHVQTYGDQVPFQGHSVRGFQGVADLARTGIPRLFRTLKRLGVPADAIGQSPFVPAWPRYCAAGMEPYRCALRRSVAIADEAYNRARVKRWLRGLPGNPKLTTQSNLVCTANVCQGTVGGINTYYDYGHIGARMSLRMAPYFRPTVDKLLNGVR
jgi:SGNH domain (fused to AT3 domains)